MKPDCPVVGKDVLAVCLPSGGGFRLGVVPALALLGFVAVVSGVIAGCGRKNPAVPEMLRIGYAVEAPYSYVREDGAVMGEGPEIARVIAGRLGIRRLEWRQVEFSSLIPELRDGSIDVIAAGMFITPERSQVVAFSRPISRVRPALLVSKGNPARIKAYGDLARGSLRVAVLAGSVEERYFREVIGLRGPQLLVVSDAHAGVRTVQEGRVDALALSAPSLRWALAHLREPRVELVDEGVSPAPVGLPTETAFAFRPGDRALREAWDAEMARFIGSAEHRTLARAWGVGNDDVEPGVEPAEGGQR